MIQPFHLTVLSGTFFASAMCRNLSIERMRHVEDVVASSAAMVDLETVEFISGTSASHPDMMLQHKLQEAIDAKVAADVRREALLVRTSIPATRLTDVQGCSSPDLRCNLYKTTLCLYAQGACMEELACAG